MKRIICWFSCGAPSAVAAKITIERYRGVHEVAVVNCDTRPSEHEDNYRFTTDIERWLGVPIHHISNPKYRTVDDVFEKERYMSGIGGARCTLELKKAPRLAYAEPDDIHVWGLACDEQDRITDFDARNPDIKSLWILVLYKLTKQDCINELRLARIKLPEMYLLGFDNNNCPGCVKASSPWYWDMVRKHFPEVFKRRCAQSRAIGCRLVEIHHHERIFLDELPPGPFTKYRENLSCGPECGIQLKLFPATLPK